MAGKRFELGLGQDGLTLPPLSTLSPQKILSSKLLKPQGVWGGSMFKVK